MHLGGGGGGGGGGLSTSLYVGQVYLRRCMSAKYLVVFLDSRPTCKEHVDVKVRKAENLLWGCRRAYAATWVLTPFVP